MLPAPVAGRVPFPVSGMEPLTVTGVVDIGKEGSGSCKGGWTRCEKITRRELSGGCKKGQSVLIGIRRGSERLAIGKQGAEARN